MNKIRNKNIISAEQIGFDLMYKPRDTAINTGSVSELIYQKKMRM